jgi:hypothetical protein
MPMPAQFEPSVGAEVGRRRRYAQPFQCLLMTLDIGIGADSRDLHGRAIDGDRSTARTVLNVRTELMARRPPFNKSKKSHPSSLAGDTYG